TPPRRRSRKPRGNQSGVAPRRARPPVSTTRTGEALANLLKPKRASGPGAGRYSLAPSRWNAARGRKQPERAGQAARALWSQGVVGAGGRAGRRPGGGMAGRGGGRPGEVGAAPRGGGGRGRERPPPRGRRDGRGAPP